MNDNIFKNIKFIDKNIKKWSKKHFDTHTLFLKYSEIENLLNFNGLLNEIIESKIEKKEKYISSFFIELAIFLLDFIEKIEERSISNLEYVSAIYNTLDILAKMSKIYEGSDSIGKIKQKILKLKSIHFWNEQSGKKINLYLNMTNDEVQKLNFAINDFILTKNNLVFGFFFKNKNIFIESDNNILLSLLGAPVGEKELMHKENKPLFNIYFEIFGSIDKQKEYFEWKKTNDKSGNLNENWINIALINLSQNKKVKKQFSENEINTLYRNMLQSKAYISNGVLIRKFTILVICNYLNLVKINKNANANNLNDKEHEIINFILKPKSGKSVDFIKKIIVEIEKLIRDILDEFNIDYLNKEFKEENLTKQIKFLYENKIINSDHAAWLIYLLVDAENGVNLRNDFIGHTAKIEYSKVNHHDLILLLLVAMDLKTILIKKSST